MITLLVEGGYTTEQIAQIVKIIVRYAEQSHYSYYETQDAATQYLMICRDIDKLAGFLQLSEKMNRQFAASWEDSYKFVLQVVCGWCK